MSDTMEDKKLSDASSDALDRSDVSEKALVRKIDLHLLPMLFTIYVAAFLDRVNISNALTMGLPKQLGLTGYQPNIALTIFFVPYILFEIPSNVILKKLKPHIWLSTCILAFGIIMIAQGFVKSYGGLLATRFFLGLAEAGIFPGSFYLIGMWYKREESLKRFTVYWCSVLTATSFGGLLASAIANLDGVRGLHNWQWLFILEGIVTILIGIVAFFKVADFPEQAKWLTEQERELVLARTGRHSEAEPVRLGDVARFFKDPKKVLGGIMYLAVVVPIYAFAYFAPTIIKTYGYKTVQTQLHTVPPVAAALGLCLIIALLSDRLQLRTPFIAFCLALSLTGFAILLTVHHSFSVQYLGICLIAMGSFSNGVVVVNWYIMNLRGHAEKSIGSAWMIGFGNCGGIIATFSFLTKDAPFYHTGYSICLGAVCLCIVSCLLYAALAYVDNKKIASKGDEMVREKYSF